MRATNIHFNIRHWLDQIGTPRYDPDQLDAAINIAISELMNEVLGEGKFAGASSPELDNYTKNVLNRLLRTNTVENGFSVAEDKRLNLPLSSIFSSVSDFRRIESIVISTENNEYFAYPVTRSEMNSNYDHNTFDKPTLEYPAKVTYVLEKSTIIFDPKDVFKIDDADNEKEKVISIKVSYVKTPSKVTAGQIVPHTITGRVSVSSPGIVYTKTARIDGLIYKRGAYLTNLYIDDLSEILEDGSIAFDFVDPEFPDFLENEISKRAALALGLPSERMDKLKSIFA